MNVEIKYQPAYALAIVRLERGEAVQAESGAMVSMSDGISIETSMKGGVVGALKRTILGGESLFFNLFTSDRSGAEITLAPSLPGDIMTTPVNGTLYLQSGSFLAANPDLNIDTKWGGAKTFFGSEGLFLLKAHGQGTVVASSYGAIHKVTLAGERYVCDTGHVVAFTDGLDFDVRRVGGFKSTLLSGEGLVCDFRGHGDLYIQSRSTQAFLSWLIPRLPAQGREGGRGGQGILGDLLRG